MAIDIKEITREPCADCEGSSGSVMYAYSNTLHVYGPTKGPVKNGWETVTVITYGPIKSPPNLTYHQHIECTTTPITIDVSPYTIIGSWECSGPNTKYTLNNKNENGRYIYISPLNSCFQQERTPSSKCNTEGTILDRTQTAYAEIIDTHTMQFNIQHATDIIAIGNADLARVGDPDVARLYDTKFEYHVANISIYDTVRPGYSDTANQAIRDGLDRWVDLNPHISFVPVNDRDRAELYVSMGGTGESRSFMGDTDTYGRVNDVGCLVTGYKRSESSGCEMTLYLENNNHDGTIDLMNPAMIEYVTVHEIGHLLGLPHHPSALHAMHNTLDTDVKWYDDEYGFIAPVLKPPNIRTMEAEESYKQVRDNWEQIRPSIGSTQNETKLVAIIITLLNLLG